MGMGVQKLKKFLLILVLSILWLCQYAQVDPNLKSYTSKKWGFSFSYPSTWVMDLESADNIQVKGIATAENDYGAPTIDVSITPFPLVESTTTLKELMDIILPLYGDILAEQGIDVVDMEELGYFNNGNQELFALGISAAVEDIDLEMIQCLGLMGTNIFIVSMATRTEEIDTIGPIFLEILNSFSFGE